MFDLGDPIDVHDKWAVNAQQHTATDSSRCNGPRNGIV
jgi:hypothetical protein